jgi:hypothetical protein
MSQHHTSRTALAMCVVGGRTGRGTLARPRCLLWPWARSTRAKLDSLARYTPSSASMGTMRAGGTDAKRGSLATLSSLVRSSGLRAWLGVGRTAWGLPSAWISTARAFQRCNVRSSMPAISQARRNRAPASWAMSMSWARLRRSSRPIIRPRPCGRSPLPFLTAPAKRPSPPAPGPCDAVRARAP